jgi:hypothetical protein
VGVSWLRLDVTTASVLAAGLMVAAVAVRPFRRRWSAWATAAALETALVCVLFALWQLANEVAHTRDAGGLAHGQAVWDLERAMHIPNETWFQQLILDHGWLVRASNYYYATAHLTGMAVFLVWLWVRHRDRYPQWRNVMVGFTGVSLLVQMVPVAPPRMLDGVGLEDTAMAYGQSVYAIVGSNLADQYAAMPSIHAGWALLIAIACYSCSSSPWRWVGVAHGLITTYVIVATANHYWLDAAVAAAILGLAYAAERGLASLPRLQIQQPASSCCSLRSAGAPHDQSIGCMRSRHESYGMTLPDRTG